MSKEYNVKFDFNNTEAKRKLKELNVELDKLQKQAKENIKLGINDETIKAKINGLKSEISSLTQGSLKSLEGGLLKMAGAVGVAFGTAEIINFGKEAYLAYEQQIRQERLLLNALGGRKEALNQLIKQASELSKVVGVDDDDIMSVQAMAAAHNLTTEQIKKATEAALNFSDIMGVDLHAASIAVLQTYEGQIGRLGRLDSDFKKLTTTQLENGGAIDLLNSKYGTWAEESATSTDKMKVAWNEFKETAGEALSGLLPIMTKTATMLNNIMGAFKMGMSYDEFVAYDKRKKNLEEYSTAQLRAFLQNKKINKEEEVMILNILNARRIEAGEDKKRTAEKIAFEKAIRDEIKKSTDLEALKTKYEGDTAAIKIIDAEINRRKKLAEEIKNHKTEYEKLTIAIEDNKKKLQDLITQKAQGKKIDDNQLKSISDTITKLNAEKDAVDRLNAAYLARSLNKSLDGTIGTITEGKSITSAKVKGKQTESEYLKEQLKDSMVLRTSYQEQVKKLNEEKFNNFLDNEENKRKALQESLMLGVDLVSTLVDSQYAAEINAIDELMNKLDEKHQLELNQLEEKKTKGLLTEEQYNSEKLRIDNAFELEQKKLKEKQWKLQQEQQITDVIIKGITAAATTFAQFGFPFGLIPAGLMAAITAAQVQQIKSTPMPKFAEGGSTIGLLNGRSHNTGGIPIEVEGGEFIVRKSAVSQGANLELLNSINNSNTDVISNLNAKLDALIYISSQTKVVLPVADFNAVNDKMNAIKVRSQF